MPDLLDTIAFKVDRRGSKRFEEVVQEAQARVSKRSEPNRTGPETEEGSKVLFSTNNNGTTLLAATGGNAVQIVAGAVYKGYNGNVVVVDGLLMPGDVDLPASLGKSMYEVIHTTQFSERKVDFRP